MKKKHPAAVALGRIGGKAKSQAKTAANRRNAKQPRKRTAKWATK